MAWRDLNIDISYDTFRVRIHADDSPKLELSSKCILVTQPDYVSNGDVSFCGVPFASHKQIWTSELTPGLPDVVDLGLYLSQSFVRISGEVERLEITALRSLTKQERVRCDVF